MATSPWGPSFGPYGRQNNSPFKNIHVLIPRICNLLPYIAQGAYKYD